MDAENATEHWADKEEIVSSDRALKFTLKLIQKLPAFIVYLIVYPVSFFYFLISKRARKEARLYQKQLKSFTGGKVPLIVRPYRQILSFSMCIVEKFEGWLGKMDYSSLICGDDDLNKLCADLENGKGALLIGSHLGNIELLRSLSSYNKTGVDRKFSVTAIMEVNAKAALQFNKALREVNPGAYFNLIDPGDIGPDTICELSEQIENGGLVFCAADRTSARTRNRCIRTDFLGKPADFPYGVFLIAALLNAPTYFMFALRTRTASLFPRYNMFVERAKTDFNCPRSEREERIRALCREFVDKLEKYCVMFPFQWYNFFDFWFLQDQ